MPSAATDSVRASLTAALEDLQRQHAQLTEDLARVEHSEDQLRTVLQGLADVDLPQRRPRQLQVSEERLARVRDYMLTQREARQADIGPATGENSGTVSLALRVLAGEGLIVKGELAKGSRVWRVADHDGSGPS